MTILARFLRNSFFLTIAMAVDRVAVFVMILYMTRLMTTYEMGEYFVVMSMLYVFQGVVNFGLVQLATREVARDVKRAHSVVPYLGLIGIGMGLLATLGMVLIASLWQFSHEISRGLLITSCSLIPGSLRGVGEAVFTAVERTEIIAWVTGLSGLLRGVLCVCVLWLAWGLVGVLAVLVVTQWVVAAIYLATAGKLVGWPDGHISADIVRSLVRPAMTFAAMSLFLVGANNINVLLVSRLGSVEEAALYALAYSLMQAVVLWRPILERSIFPSLVKVSRNTLELRRVTAKMLRLLTVLLGPLPFLIFLAAESAVGLLYSEDFAGVARALQILGWGLLFSYLWVALHRVLLAMNEERVALRVSAISMVVNLVVGFLLIPIAGATGAAIASLASWLGALLVAYGRVRQSLGIRFGPVFGGPVLGLLVAGAFGVAVDCVGQFPAWVSVASFMAAYLGAMFAVGAISWRAMGDLWQATRGNISR